MKSKFKDEDILKFLYDEMLPETSELFLDSLSKDEELFEKYEYYQEIEDRLETLSYEPSDISCQKVMDFVKADIPVSPPKKRGNIFPTSVGMGLIVAAFLMLFVTKGILNSNEFASAPIEKEVYVQDMRLIETADLSWDDELGDRIESIEERTKNMSDEPLL